jgi:hypothetical protein
MSEVACSSIWITSPDDPATVAPFLFPCTYKSFKVLMTFQGSSDVVNYTEDSGWNLTIVSGERLATAKGRAVAATGSGAGVVEVKVWFRSWPESFGLNSSSVGINVLSSAAESASLSCSGQDCGGVQIANPSDPVSSPPLSIRSSTELVVSVKLVNRSLSVQLPFDNRTVFTILSGEAWAEVDGNRLVAKGVGMNESGIVQLQGRFPGVFNFTTQNVSVRVVRLTSLTMQLVIFGGAGGMDERFGGCIARVPSRARM